MARAWWSAWCRLKGVLPQRCGRSVSRIGHDTEIAEDILDVSRLDELQSAVFVERYFAARQFGFKTVSNIARAKFSEELLSLFDSDTASGRMLFACATSMSLVS